MKTAAWITAAAWAALFLLADGAVYAQGVRVKHEDGSGAKVRTGERKRGKNDLKAEKERIRRGCRRHLGKAEKLTAEGKYGLACRELATAKTLTIERKLAQRWMGLAKRLNQIGLEQLRQADQAYEQKDYPKALAEYERLSVTFIGLPVSVQARNGLSQLRHDPRGPGGAEGNPRPEAFQARGNDCCPGAAAHHRAGDPAVGCRRSEGGAVRQGGRENDRGA